MNNNLMPISTMMSAPVVTIGPDARAGEVLALADARGVHHFPILEGGRLVGVVCTCDLHDLQPESPAFQVGWRHVITLPPEASVDDAARLMLMHSVGSIVVTDESGPCGVVTRDDLIRAYPGLDAQLFRARCSSCGAHTHLRPGSDGEAICRSCLDRADEGTPA
jgi:CBS-domain-containing membrane protein